MGLAGIILKLYCWENHSDNKLRALKKRVQWLISYIARTHPANPDLVKLYEAELQIDRVISRRAVARREEESNATA